MKEKDPAVALNYAIFLYNRSEKKLASKYLTIFGQNIKPLPNADQELLDMASKLAPALQVGESLMWKPTQKETPPPSQPIDEPIYAPINRPTTSSAVDPSITSTPDIQTHQPDPKELLMGTRSDSMMSHADTSLSETPDVFNPKVQDMYLPRPATIEPLPDSPHGLLSPVSRAKQLPSLDQAPCPPSHNLENDVRRQENKKKFAIPEL